MNTSYLPVNTTGIAQSIYDASYPEMRAEYVKWGGGESQANTNMTQYANNLAIFKNELNKPFQYGTRQYHQSFRLIRKI